MTLDPSHEVVSCNICGSSDYTVIYEAVPREATDLVEEFKSSGDEPLIDRLVACRACGLQYTSPRLRPDLILAGYEGGTDERFVSQAEGRERTFSRGLTTIEKHAPGRGRLLDVGTAAGSFLHVAKQRGWDVAGCEPNRWMCQWGQKHYGIDIRPGTLFEQNYAEGSFDVVTLWDVLEHAPDPLALVRGCARVVKPGGLLVVNYPDIGSLAAKAMGRRWVFLLSVHLYYFTRSTIAKLLAAAGLEVVEVRPHIQSLEFEYILTRAEPVAGPLARGLRRVASSVGVGRWQAPYWIGQTLIVARKATAPPAESTRS